MTLRPATPDEQRALARLEGSGLEWKAIGALWFAASVFVAGLGILYLVTKARTIAQSLFMIVVGTLSATFYLYLRRLFTRAAASAHAATASDAGTGQVDESEFSIVDAIQVSETEDEGLHFFLRLADGRVLYLSGQYLYEPVNAQRFPSSQVAIVRAPASGTVLRFTPGGTYMPPSTTRAAFTDREHARGRVPEDGDLLNADFERLRNASSAAND
jgi:hypothetical protein